MSTAKIYKIESYTTPFIYVGCTTKKYLSERLTFYRSEYKKYLKSKLDDDEFKKYIKIKTEFGNYSLINLFKLFDSFGVKSFKIILLQEINHTSLDDLKAQLYHYIKNTDCINK